MASYENSKFLLEIMGATHYNNPLRELIELLSVREIQILAKNPHLLKETKRIADMDAEKLVEELEQKMGIPVRVDDPYHQMGYGYSHYFIEAPKDLKALPKWAKARNFDFGSQGWTEYRFKEMARRLLFRRVRMNIWLAFVESDEALKMSMSIGSFLPLL